MRVTRNDTVLKQTNNNFAIHSARIPPTNINNFSVCNFICYLVVLLPLALLDLVVLFIQLYGDCAAVPFDHDKTEKLSSRRNGQNVCETNVRFLRKKMNYFLFFLRFRKKWKQKKSRICTCAAWANTRRRL